MKMFGRLEGRPSRSAPWIRAVIGIAAVLGLLASSPMSAAAAPAGAPDYAAIDAYVSNSLAGIPGFALSIVHGDQIVHAKGFGVDGAGSAVTPETPFILGSESKSFTALAIMQLKESGALDLNAPVQTYLPWFRVADPNYSRQITIRQLLNQTSGLPASFPFETPVTSVVSRVRALASVALAAAPGKRWEYSNSNYDTLGLVVEAVSGESYTDYIQQHVFAPLNMTHSYASESSARAGGLASGNELFFGVPVASTSYRSDLLPAGWIVSTAADMGNYLIAQLNAGTYAGTQVVSAAGVAEMHRGVAPANGATYGMGWYDISVNGIPAVSHDGEAVTFQSDMILVPSAGWGVELIGNASGLVGGLPSSIDNSAKGVISMLMGKSASFSPSTLDTYIVYDLLVIFVIAFQVWSLIRMITKPAPQARPGTWWALRHLVAPVMWRLALAMAAYGVVFVILGGQLGASPLFIAETDLGASVLAVSALLMANGVTRAARAYGAIRSRRSVESVSVPSTTLQEAAI